MWGHGQTFTYARPYSAFITVYDHQGPDQCKAVIEDEQTGEYQQDTNMTQYGSTQLQDISLLYSLHKILRGNTTYFATTSVTVTMLVLAMQY